MTLFRDSFHILLLAAGKSLRMGRENKLLMPYGRKPMIRHIAQQLLKADMGEVTVVTGFEAEGLSKKLRGLKLNLCFNPDFEAGQMSSVKTGISHLPQSQLQSPSGVMVVLADMPSLTWRDYRHLADAFFRHSPDKITIPYYDGKRGNPIIIPGYLLPEIRNGTLHAGCKNLIRNHPDKVHKLPVSSSAFIRDIDTPADYDQVTRHHFFSHAPCC